MGDELGEGCKITKKSLCRLVKCRSFLLLAFGVLAGSSVTPKETQLLAFDLKAQSRDITMYQRYPGYTLGSLQASRSVDGSSSLENWSSFVLQPKLIAHSGIKIVSFIGSDFKAPWEPGTNSGGRWIQLQLGRLPLVLTASLASAAVRKHSVDAAAKLCRGLERPEL